MRRVLSVVAFALVLTFAALRGYRYPQYSTDGLSYMANTVAMTGASIEEIHAIVYRAAKVGIPGPAYDHLTGNDSTAPAPQNDSFRDRAVNPRHFAEYLPCFAVRPLFTEIIYMLHYWLGVGLLNSVVLVAAASYWLLGWLVLAWMRRFLGTEKACALSIILMLTPPLWDFARSTTPDSLSCLFCVFALFLLLEQRRLLPGLIVLTASVYVRTDNIILVVLALTYLCVVDRSLRVSHGTTLSVLALGSVVLINHFSGDYGAKMLYYRIDHTPTAIGEFVPSFGIRNYFLDLKSAIAEALHGHFLSFLLMGGIGLLRRRSRAVVALTTVSFVYAAVHLVLYPVAQTRYFGVFFAASGIAAASAAFFAKTPATIREHDRIVQAVTAGMQ